jgi:peptidoglycan-associated lipoprotein
MNTVSKATLAALFAALAWGCSSTPPADNSKPAVEDRSPSEVVPPPGPRTGSGAQSGVSSTPLPGANAVNPLKDPNNILSKRSIYYDYDSDAIKDEYKPILEAHGRYLTGNRAAKMLIQGNTDERGSREYNIALGQRRAEAVKRLLVLQGAQDTQIEAVSLGKEKPRCEQASEDCYSQNRRSDLLYGGEY